MPAFNAHATISSTLASALAQTHQRLEVLVVDDGSTDATAGIVAEIAAADPRLLLIKQANAGVAAARNRALAQSRGDFVAYLDADDLWVPEKLALQLAALQAAPKAALAYAWFRRINGQDRILPPSPHPRVEGRVLHRHLAWNFISNGSAVMVKGDVARNIAFDPTLRRGCEDYLHQMLVALDHDFVCVPQFLVGYRRTPGSLSASRSTMEQGHLDMFERLGPRLPESAHHVLVKRRAEMHARLSRTKLKERRLVAALNEARFALQEDAPEAARNMANALRALTRGGPRPDEKARAPFADLDPTLPDGRWQTRHSRSFMKWLEDLDGGATT